MSHNAHLGETQRLEKTFKEYLTENKGKFDKIDQVNKNIEKDLHQIRDKIYDNIRKKCNVQFEWLDRHATVKFDDQGMLIHVNENPDGISADSILGELDVCASKNDYGLKKFFDSANTRKSYIIDENKRCVNKCAFRSEEKKVEEIKSCVDKCFSNSFENTHFLLNEVRDKLENVKNEFH
jgi:hypothetical protein